MHILRRLFYRLTGKKLPSSASVEEQYYYLEHGGAVLEEHVAVSDGNCRIPLRYLRATEIEMARHQHDPQTKMDLGDSFMVTGSLDKRLVLFRFFFYGGSHSLVSPVYRDVAITAQISHLKNVLRLIGLCIECKNPVMVYEYVESPILLSTLLFEKPRKLVSWEMRLKIANDIASALLFLHSEFTTPIISRAVAPKNVIIDKKISVAKLVNLSLSISLPRGEMEVEDAVIGTYGYADPEYIRSGIINQKSDVYSFGVVLLELLTRRPISNIHKTADGKMRSDNGPYDLESTIKECNVMDIVDPDILEEQGQQLEDYFDLVKKCIASKGEDRPYMIHVAKELLRIRKCLRSAHTVAHN